MSENTNTSERMEISDNQIKRAISLLSDIDSGVLDVGSSFIVTKIVQTFQPFVRFAQLANDPEEAGREKSDLMRMVSGTKQLEHPIAYLEAELDSLEESYKKTGKTVHSQRVLETKKALKILREYH